MRRVVIAAIRGVAGAIVVGLTFVGPVPRRWKRGAVVGLSLDPAGCLPFPEDPGPTGADAAPSERPMTAGEPLPDPSAV